MEYPDRIEVERLVDAREWPAFARVGYEPPTERVDDPAGAARAELDRLPLDRLDPGATVAVGVGSRGIHDVDAIAAAVVAGLDERGFEPVVVPAMGSHGGATPAGQREVLASLGVAEASIGAPIDARMDTERVATVSVGGTELPVHLSTAALAADGVVVLNRVKPHTNYTGRLESGLAKMTVVGLGKQAGAGAFHSVAIEHGYVETLEAALSAVLAAAPVVGGVALVENFHEETAHVEAVPASSFAEREPELLERAYDEMATLPVDDVDLLVVDEIGKEISGAGMDTNVVGRYRVLNADEPDEPDVGLIYVRGLTEDTKGNGVGIGLADVTRRAAVDQLDLGTTYANVITSGSLAKAKLPVVAPDDDLALAIAAGALGAYDPDTVRIVWIENTRELAELLVSAPLVDDLPDGATVEGHVTLAFEDGTRSFEPQ